MNKLNSTKMETIQGGKPKDCWNAAIMLAGAFFPGGLILASSRVVAGL